MFEKIEERFSFDPNNKADIYRLSKLDLADLESEIQNRFIDLKNSRKLLRSSGYSGLNYAILNCEPDPLNDGKLILKTENTKNRTPRNFDLSTPEFEQYIDKVIKPRTSYTDSDSTQKISGELLSFLRAYRYKVNNDIELTTDVSVETYDPSIGRTIYKAEWQRLKELVNTPREYGESRAVRVDDTIYANAAQAIICNWGVTDPTGKQGNELYKQCEKGHWYKGSYVDYATPEEIDMAISQAKNA